MEVMGRHAGWITAACGLAADGWCPAAHPAFPELPFDETALPRPRFGLCRSAWFTVSSPSRGAVRCLGGSSPRWVRPMPSGIPNAGRGRAGDRATGQKDRLRFSITGPCPTICSVRRAIWPHASMSSRPTQWVRAAVRLALAGRNAVMPGCVWPMRRIAEIGVADLADIANVERKMPRGFISADGFHITDKCRAYLSPLIEGEVPSLSRRTARLRCGCRNRWCQNDSGGSISRESTGTRYQLANSGMRQQQEQHRAIPQPPQAVCFTLQNKPDPDSVSNESGGSETKSTWRSCSCQLY